jgi:signal transduction histidine kinase
MRRPAVLRPLDRLPSIRAKLGIVIVFAVGVTILLMYVAIGLTFRHQDQLAQLDALTNEAKTVAVVGFDKTGAVTPALRRVIHQYTPKAVVLRADGSTIVADFALPPGADHVLRTGAPESGSFEKLYYAGVPVYRNGAIVAAVYLAHQGSGGGFVGTLRGTAGVVRRNMWQLLAAGAAAAVVALILARLLARGMTQPLRDMARAAERLARSDYSERVPVTSRDELGRTAETFNRMATELESVERLRRDLIANVSHELKTPISALRAHLENLLDGVEEPNPDTLAVMLQQSERLGRLVEQLLDLSRLESGVVAFEPQPLSLQRVLQRVIGEVQVGRDGGVQVQDRIPDGFPQVLADEERIHQLLFNLLDNALRFTPHGGRVTVTAIRHESECEVSVEDTGPGIPPKHQPFVFERFYRVDPSRSRSDGGTGIGLTIAKSVVEGHGGRIWVDRAQGGGAAFRFTLPLAPIGTADRLGPVLEPPGQGTEDQHATERRPSGIAARQG